MLKWFFLYQKRRSWGYSNIALRILLPWPYRSTYWPDDHFNMRIWGVIKSTMACSTQQNYNQSCWSDISYSRSIETIVPPAMHWEFYFHGNSEAPSDQAITSTWAIGVGLSPLWPVPHRKAKISHVEVIYAAAEASVLSFFQQCIESFTSMAIPKHLVTRRSLQHEQLGWDKSTMACSA